MTHYFIGLMGTEEQIDYFKRYIKQRIDFWYEQEKPAICNCEKSAKPYIRELKFFEIVADDRVELELEDKLGQFAGDNIPIPALVKRLVLQRFIPNKATISFPNLRENPIRKAIGETGGIGSRGFFIAKANCRHSTVNCPACKKPLPVDGI